jgi:hypothetical protein
VKALLLIFAIWVLGSIVTFATVGTKYIIPYALVTMALVALAVWLANKKNQPPTAGNAYGFALPLLFLLHFNLSGWWLLGLLLVAVWAWALSRKQEGDYDFGPGMALGAALVFTLACLVGVAFGWVLA